MPLTLKKRKPTFKTINDVKAEIEIVIQDPKKSMGCPCCGKRVISQVHTITSGLTKYLERIYEEGGYNNRDYVHVTSTIFDKDLVRIRRYSFLKHWGLLIALPGKGEKSKTSGMWKVTEKGEQFLRNKISIPKMILLYNKKLIRIGDEMVSRSDLRGKPFDFWEMMEKGMDE